MTNASLLRVLALCCGLVALAAPVLAASCPEPNARGKRGANAPCPPQKFEPYDPDRARAVPGRTGFIDVGGGTEVRISGRTRFEYQSRN